MICNKCHAQVEEGTTVCPVCGAAIEEEILGQEASVMSPSESADSSNGDIHYSMTKIGTEPNRHGDWHLYLGDRDPLDEFAPVCEEVSETNAEEMADASEMLTEETAEGLEELVEVLVPAKKKTWIKVTAIALCAALVLGLASMVWYGVNGGWKPRGNDVSYKDQYYAQEDKAVKAADDVIATVGDVELTNGQFQVFYWMNVYEFYRQYGDYIGYLGFDLAKPFHEQISGMENSTWEQYFIDSALNTWHSYQSMLLYAQKEGYVMSDELTQQLAQVRTSMDVSAAQYGLANADEMVQLDMGPSADMEDYMYYLTVYYGGMEYVDGLYAKMVPTDAEIEAYYEANADTLKSSYGVDKESGKLIDVRHILVIPEGGTTDENNQTVYSDDEWAACLAEAEEILKQWKDGEATEDSFAALATEKTEDPGSQGTGGLYTYVYEGQMVPAFNDWCFDESRQYGDTDIVKTNYGYHIMYFVYSEEGWSRRAKEALITDACSEVIQKAMEEYPMEVKYKKIVIGKADMSQ